MQFVENGFVENGFVEINSDSSDCFLIFQKLNERINFLDVDIRNLLNILKKDLTSQILNLKVDLTPINDNLDNLKKDLISSLSENVFNKFPSLNGAYGSYKDGTFVTSSIYTTKLKVLGSFLALNEADNYIVFYIVENASNNVIILPSVFVSLYVEKVIEGV